MVEQAQEYDDDDNAPMAFDDGDDDDNGDHFDQSAAPPDDAMEVDDATPDQSKSDDSAAAQSKPDETKSPDDSSAPESSNKDEETNDKPEETKAPVVRRRLARPKLGKLSAPAQKALEKNQKSVVVAPALSAPAVIDTTSASFRPEQIAADTSAAASHAATLENILQKAQDGSDNNYVDMYWIDACEDRGDIYVFGKVETSPNEFQSCCAVVKGNLRNLFVLPREGEELLAVHSELQSVLQPSCIPRKEGASWAGKMVKRKYAFEDSTIPRDETSYLKVVYDAKYNVPSVEVCRDGGKTFAKILGAGASNLENFIVKRKLMGPCWIRLKNPVANTSTVSWCKLELQVDSPKQVARASLTKPRPPPPVVTVSIKLKTVVNPKTHKSEVVSVCALCHKQVLLDTASDESTKHMVQLSLIRPLGAIATSTNGLPQLPRDIDDEIKASMPQLSKMPNERALLSRLFCQLGTWDPDVLVGHNSWGHDIQVLLNRCVELKVSMWSKIGRRCVIPTCLPKNCSARRRTH